MTTATPPTRVFDTSAVLAYLNSEVGWDVVAAILANATNVCAIHSVNLCEVWHITRQSQDEPTTDHVISTIRQLSIVEYSDIDPPFWKEVGKLRHFFRTMSVNVPLMDCFAMALAARYSVPVVVADHGDFDLAQKQNVCQVVFIRVSISQGLDPTQFAKAIQP